MIGEREGVSVVDDHRTSIRVSQFVIEGVKLTRNGLKESELCLLGLAAFIVAKVCISLDHLVPSMGLVEGMKCERSARFFLS